MYTCSYCGKTWTEDEFYEAVDDNEDDVVLMQSCGMCPDCWNVDDGAPDISEMED